MDRILGAGFGVLKALLICATLVMAATLVLDVLDGREGDGTPDWVKQSRTYPLLRATGAAVSDIVAERLDDRPGSGDDQNGSAGNRAQGGGA